MRKGRLGKLFALGLGCSMIMSSFTNGTAVKAAEQAVESSATVNNRCVMLQAEQAPEICDFVIKNITEKYEGDRDVLFSGFLSTYSDKVGGLYGKSFSEKNHIFWTCAGVGFWFVCLRGECGER